LWLSFLQLNSTDCAHKELVEETWEKISMNALSCLMLVMEVTALIQTGHSDVNAQLGLCLMGLARSVLVRMFEF
jgi:hypothetical protein